MSDLISRADAIEAMCCDCEGEHYPKCDQKQYCKEVKALLALPSADAEHNHEDGQWQTEDGKPSKAEYSVYCSKCGSWSEYRTKYCGNCGSLMKEENDEQ